MKDKPTVKTFAVSPPTHKKVKAAAGSADTPINLFAENILRASVGLKPLNPKPKRKP